MKQHEVALARGNEVRLRRAKLKQEIKSGEVSLSELLIEPALPKWLEAEPTARLIRYIPLYGNDRAGKLCELLKIPELTPIGKLTYRKRRELADELARRLETRELSGKRPRSHQRSTRTETGQAAGQANGSFG